MKKYFWLLVSLFFVSCASQGEEELPPVPATYSFNTTTNEVSWNFRESTKAVVEFGKNKISFTHFGYDARISNFGKTGKVRFLGLEPNTKYFYRIRGTSLTQNVSYTKLDSFVTSETLPAEKYFSFVTIDVSRDGSGITWGDALFIQTPSGKNILIDAGPNTVQSTANIRQVFSNFQVTQIDYAFVTHDHADHYYGFFNEMFNSEFPITNFYYPNDPFELSAINDVKDVLESYGTVSNPAVPNKTSETESYLKWENGDFFAKVLSSGLGKTVGNSSSQVNNDSVVLFARYGKAEYVFTGDFEIDAQEKITFPEADVLKVAHHGRLDATSDKILSETTPLLATISTQFNTSVNDGVFQPQVLASYTKNSIDVFRTDNPNPQNDDYCFSNIYTISDGQTIIASYECLGN
ncbi:MBL fold metallo-hydrolase [bacterium]|nr:MBL fold metallo-hydrolase [bacterium]